MAVPTASTPIPPEVRHIVERVHHRYVAEAIDNPLAAVGLLTALECVALAKSGYYPIPPFVIRYGCTPKEYRRQQILEIIAEQLPEAVRAVLEIIEI